MATPATTVPMLSPDGKVGDIPVDRVQDAIKAGFKQGVDMISPNGKHGTIPVDQAEAAQKAGFKLLNQHLLPEGDMQKALDSPVIQDLEKGNIQAAKIGSDTLAGGAILGAGANAVKSGIGALTSPTAGAVKSVGTGLVDAAGKEITKDVATEGPSILSKSMATLTKAKPYLEGLEKLGIGVGGIGYIIKALHDASHEK